MSHCGKCMECCYYMEVTELRKPVNNMCKHACEGCSIYEVRPQSCRDFNCMWLQSQDSLTPMPAKLRPDRCGVMFAATTHPMRIAAHSRMKCALGAAETLRAFVRFLVIRGVEIIHVCHDKRTLIRLNRQVASDSKV